jgi:hypothetical protein
MEWLSLVVRFLPKEWRKPVSQLLKVVETANDLKDGQADVDLRLDLPGNRKGELKGVLTVRTKKEQPAPQV